MQNLTKQEQEQLSRSIEKIRRSCPTAKPKKVPSGSRKVRLVTVTRTLEHTLDRR